MCRQSASFSHSAYHSKRQSEKGLLHDCYNEHVSSHLDGSLLPCFDDGKSRRSSFAMSTASVAIRCCFGCRSKSSFFVSAGSMVVTVIVSGTVLIDVSSSGLSSSLDSLSLLSVRFVLCRGDFLDWVQHGPLLMLSKIP